MNTSISIPFHGNTLFLVEHNGEAYTPMKPIVEGMGLDWASQFTKLKQRFASTIVEIAMVAEDGKQRSMTCLLLRKLTGWLYTISANKVKAELREKILQYQSECDDVLWQHWSQSRNHGAASTTLIAGQTIGTDGFQCLAALVDGKTRHLPSPARRSAKMHIWSQVHKAYSVVSAEQIPTEMLDSARCFIAAHAVEGEWMPPQKELPHKQAGYLLTDNEATALSGVFSMVDMMRDTLKELEPPLRLLKAPISPRVYDGWHEIGMFMSGTKKLREHCRQAYLTMESRVLGGNHG